MLRIATWNLERPTPTSPKNPARLERLRAIDADIFILTETHSAISLAPDYDGRATAPSARKPRPGESVAAIWYRRDRFELVAELETSDPSEAICLLLRDGAKELLVYGSILPYHGYLGPSGNLKPWRANLNAIDWHEQDWLSLARAHPRATIIAGGDYNQVRDGVGSYGSADVRKRLTSALHATRLTCVTEMDMVAAGLSSRHSVDHICVSAEYAGRLSGVGAWEGTHEGVRLSDHNGVFVDFSR